jgi:hypothetical protein
MAELQHKRDAWGNDHYWYDGRTKRRPGDLCRDGVIAIVSYRWDKPEPDWYVTAEVQTVANDGYTVARTDRIALAYDSVTAAVDAARLWLAAHTKDEIEAPSHCPDCGEDHDSHHDRSEIRPTGVGYRDPRDS